MIPNRSHKIYRSKPVKTLAQTNHKHSNTEKIEFEKEILYNRCKCFGLCYYYITIFILKGYL